MKSFGFMKNRSYGRMIAEYLTAMLGVWVGFHTKLPWWN